MISHPPYPLASNWALDYDEYQWIVLRRRNCGTQTGWKPVAFIATEKRILLRVLKNKGISLTPEAQAFLDAMPDSFQEFFKSMLSTPANDNQPSEQEGYNE